MIFALSEFQRRQLSRAREYGLQRSICMGLCGLGSSLDHTLLGTQSTERACFRTPGLTTHGYAPRELSNHIDHGIYTGMIS